MITWIKDHWVFLALVLFLLLWSLFLWFVDPTEIVRQIGVENTYLVAFFLALFGGLSSVTGASFFAAIATFASGGAHPFLLGFWGGLGIFLSDLVFFFIARRGIKSFEKHAGLLTEWLVRHLKKWPTFLWLVGVYLYIGFTPLPNDVLMIALALTKVRLSRIWPVILAGAITIVTVTALLGESFTRWFS